MEDIKLNIEEIDSDSQLEMIEIKQQEVQQPKQKKIKAKTVKEEHYNTVSCLRNERITVKFIPKLTGIWGNNPKHVLSGGMADNAYKVFVVPKLSSGMYVNVLTDAEKEYLEEVMGLEYNALSIYKKQDNFWDDSNDNGINRVRLSKQDNYLNLSNPEDYIRYKILLANKNYIAPSLQQLQDYPKATYQFVIISENDETKQAKMVMSTTMECYKEFGKIEDDIDTLRVIVETISGKTTSSNTKLEFLQTKINEFIQTNSKLFLKVVKDPYLQTKVLIKKAIENGIISNRGGYLYFNNEPLCSDNEEPTLNIAAKYINLPKNQEKLFSIQAKLK